MAYNFKFGLRGSRQAARWDFEALWNCPVHFNRLRHDFLQVLISLTTLVA